MEYVHISGNFSVPLIYMPVLMLIPHGFDYLEPYTKSGSQIV